MEPAALRGMGRRSNPLSHNANWVLIYSVMNQSSFLFKGRTVFPGVVGPFNFI